ncbi:Phosphatidylserine decarboxylase proenzyme 2 [Hypsizygus marmoreus]|uniref:phosphatidylserine decarboxylase n=1 Tax=Hypsizygus marmoreus TaxID=39966 RepID=A0A369JWZ8_HYPMA|nr:Phosphatidylserine decarboxylase proenzyme 2 [Hypsizygus marmoreus]
MASPKNPTDKPVESIHPDNLPDAQPDHLATALTALVDHSAQHTDVGQGIHAPMHLVFKIPWIHKLIPGIEKLAVAYHIGNFVLVRETGEPIFESMPLYARVGMHLLFYGRGRALVLGTQTIEHLLREQSIKEGKIFDSPKSVQSIPSFVQTYSLKTDELLEPNLNAYKCFNEFFSRRLRPDARPVHDAESTLGICSAADCRLTVYQSIDLAKEFWIKGTNFTIPNLLNLAPSSKKAKAFSDASVAIFRLAPADYHRFHSPIDCTVGDVDDIPGQYYTVNPQAVNEDFDVFTANRRAVLYLTHVGTGLPVAFVAIGALLVGSIQWTGGNVKGRQVKRGEELGYFLYGGSTVVAVFPKGVIEFDEDLVKNSKQPIETLVKVGHSIGKTPSGTAGKVRNRGASLALTNVLQKFGITKGN